MTACSAAATRPAVLAPRTGRRALRPLPRRQPTLTRLRGAAANPAGWPWRTRLSARSGRILEYVHEVRPQPPRRQQAARLSADSLAACLLQGENRPADTWKCHKPGCGQQFRTRENLVKHNSRTSHQPADGGEPLSAEPTLQPDRPNGPRYCVHDDCHRQYNRAGSNGGRLMTIEAAFNYHNDYHKPNPDSDDGLWVRPPPPRRRRCTHESGSAAEPRAPRSEKGAAVRQLQQVLLL